MVELENISLTINFN